MAPNKKQKKRLLSIEETPQNIHVKFQRPKRSTVIAILLIVFLIIVLLIAYHEPELHTKALELVMSIIEAIVTSFGVTPKSK